MQILAGFTFGGFFAIIFIMMNLKKRRIILAICVLAFLLAVPAILLYTDGYRIDSTFHLYKTGGLYVSSPINGSTIFVNNIEKKQTNILQSGLFLQSLKPGKYAVLIAKDGYWPWLKNLEVKEEMVTEARAMLVPKEPEAKILLRENYSPLEIPDYDEILKTLKKINEKLETDKKKKSIPEGEIEKNYTRLTTNEKEKIWWNPKENKLWAEWEGEQDSIPYFFCDDKSCAGKTLILDSKYEIRNADFYPKRKDVVIVAVQNGIFAIEIDSRGGRLLQPIYKGKNPIFTTNKNENAIYILEEENILIKIKLE